MKTILLEKKDGNDQTQMVNCEFGSWKKSREREKKNKNQN